MNKKLLKYSIAFATVAFLGACGDDSSSSSASDKTKTVATMEELGDCTENLVGETIYVEDEDKTYVCEDEKWTLDEKDDDTDNDDKDVDNKDDGKKDASSSSVKSDDDNKDDSSSSVKSDDDNKDVSSSSAKSDDDDKDVSSSSVKSGDDDKPGSSASEQTTSSSSGESKTESKCGDVTFEPETQFCAKRGDKQEGVYPKVTIGEGADVQTWMAENLNYETADGSYCYDNKAENCTKYGRLYTWAAAEKACPDGWHLPTLDEWKKLITNVDKALHGEWSELNSAGAALKSMTGWEDGGNGSIESGFSALPAGAWFDGESFGVDEDANFWSATEEDDYVYGAYLSYDEDDLWLSESDKGFAYSVRCIQDKQ